MSAFASEALPGWSTDWTSGDLWFRAIFDARVFNMFQRAWWEKSVAYFGGGTAPPDAVAGDLSLSDWGGLWSSVMDLYENTWVDPSLLLSATMDGSQPFAHGWTVGDGWDVRTALHPFYYPREITSLTPVGGEVDGWKARYIGPGGGRIFTFGSGQWSDAGDNAGLPDRAYPDSAGNLPAGYLPIGSRNAYFSGEFLNAMKTVINSMTRYYAGSTGGIGDNPTWSSSGSANGATDTSVAAALATFNSGVNITHTTASVPGGSFFVNSTGICSISKTQNHVTYTDTSRGTMARTMTIWVLGVGGFDNVPPSGDTTGCLADFDEEGCGYSNGNYANVGSMSYAGIGTGTSTEIGSDVAIAPTQPPPPTSPNKSTCQGVDQLGRGFFFILDFSSGMTYVEGYTGT